MKIQDAKAAVDKEWQVTKIKSKKEVIEKAQKEWRTIHCSTLMD